MVSQRLHLAISVLGLALLAVACADAKTSDAAGAGSGSGSANAKSSAAAADDDSSSGSKKASGSGSKSGGGSGDTEILGSWCKKAGETEVAGGDLKDMHARFCDGDSPTKLLLSTLIDKAFDGEGKPSLLAENGKKMKPTSEGKYTTADFSVGIKMPGGVTPKAHFEKVGPKGGNPDDINKLAEAQDAKGEAKIEKTLEKDSTKYLERGWEIYSKVTKTLAVAGIKKDVVQESKNKSLQFDLDEDGKAFLYVQYVLEGLQGVKDFSLYTANVMIGDQGYLLATVHVVVENQGFGAIAESQVKATAEKLVGTMYEAAKQAK